MAGAFPRGRCLASPSGSLSAAENHIAISDPIVRHSLSPAISTVLFGARFLDPAPASPKLVLIPACITGLATVPVRPKADIRSTRYSPFRSTRESPERTSAQPRADQSRNAAAAGHAEP